MATHDHTVSARLEKTLGRNAPKPTNPLSRPFWTLALVGDPREERPARLAGISMGIYALSRLLANNEALRDTQANSQAVEPGHWPLAPDLTEGLFAALYFLSEHAESLSSEPLEVPYPTP
jgi:hypothetical protein